LPPYSTVIGLLINTIGLINQSGDEYEKLKELKISISGKFENKTTEYTWFRNLRKEGRKQRFNSLTSEINGHIEQPGQQSPMSIDALDLPSAKKYS
jgi:hypothetical protein